MKTDTTCRELPCDDVHERPRFFPRQLITPDDLNLVMEYFRNKLRRHNRLLHGWGVVCGAKVCPVIKDGNAEPWKVKVEPGYILGPYGDEILIDCARTVDLRTGGVTGVTGDPCVDVPDPWCSEVFVPCETTGPLYVAVKYKEIMSRPVRVQPVGCGCDDTACEYSRWRDGYEIGILREYPKCDEKIPDFGQLKQSPLPECPPCPTDPWVVLAVIDVDSKSGIINWIDNCSCRRLVISFSEFWWRCQAGRIQIDKKITVMEGQTKLEPSKLPPGKIGLSLTVTGNNFDKGAKVYLGSGVSIGGVTVTPKTQLDFKIDIDTEARGPHTLVVQNPDCSVGILPDAITIVKPKSP